ncbi:GIY-YIG nuclease family protein [Variovorax paradoxus]|uniref:GIY-YIG nuclease family protein n=1 Tax=Variovorax paradoxus TaxID=34073 RepID=UPI003F4FB7BC
MAKTGYLYVLVHPSDPDLYKVGVTILEPGERLAQHNQNSASTRARSFRRQASFGSSRRLSKLPIPIGQRRRFGTQRRGA